MPWSHSANRWPLKEQMLLDDLLFCLQGFLSFLSSHCGIFDMFGHNSFLLVSRPLKPLRSRGRLHSQDRHCWGRTFHDRDSSRCTGCFQWSKHIARALQSRNQEVDCSFMIFMHMMISWWYLRIAIIYIYIHIYIYYMLYIIYYILYLIYIYIYYIYYIYIIYIILYIYVSTPWDMFTVTTFCRSRCIHSSILTADDAVMRPPCLRGDVCGAAEQTWIRQGTQMILRFTTWETRSEDHIGLDSEDDIFFWDWPTHLENAMRATLEWTGRMSIWLIRNVTTIYSQPLNVFWLQDTHMITEAILCWLISKGAVNHALCSALGELLREFAMKALVIKLSKSVINHHPTENGRIWNGISMYIPSFLTNPCGCRMIWSKKIQERPLQVVKQLHLKRCHAFERWAIWSNPCRTESLAWPNSGTDRSHQWTHLHCCKLAA